MLPSLLAQNLTKLPLDMAKEQVPPVHEDASSRGAPFTLIGLMMNEFSIVNPVLYAKELGPDAPDFAALQYAYTFQTNRTIRPKEDVVIMSIAIDLLLPDPSKAKIGSQPKRHLQMARAECSFFFGIADLASFIAENGNVRIPDAINLSMVGVAYSTLRGILWEKFAGTHLGGVVLPVVHPSVVLGKPVS